MDHDPFRPAQLPRSPAIPPGMELALAIVYSLVSPLLTDVPMGALFRHGGEDETVFLACVLSAAAAVRFAILAIWLAWGQSRLVWRLPIALPSIVISLVIWSNGRGFNAWQDELSLFLLLIFGTSVVVAIPRLFGVYRINVHDQAAGPETQEIRGGQFRLTDMFAWTATAAVLAGVARWVGLPRDYGWIGVVIILPVSGLMSLTAIWATLPRVESIQTRVLAAFGIALGIGTVLCLLVGGPSGAPAEAIFYINFTLELAMAMLIGALYAARCLGVRLVSQALPILIAPANMNIPTAPQVVTANETSPGATAPELEQWPREKDYD